MQPLTYPIRAVAKLTGISVDTLRAWERRYGVVEPERDERGRVYSEGDVERLTLLRRAVERGHAIGRVAPIGLEELRALVGRPAQAPQAAPVPAVVAIDELFGAVERFDLEELRRRLARLAVVLTPRQLALDVALPLMSRVGEAWHEGRLTIGQEHMATAEIRSLVGALARLQEPPPGAPRLLVATVEGEPHELGALVASLLATGAGAAPFYFGAGLPVRELVAAARRLRPRAVVLSLAGSDDQARVPAAVAELARSLPAGTACWAGGAGALAARATLAAAGVEVFDDFEAYEQALARLVA
jgi:DNA-binding transcriptional MerR regulator/methylmalonyl-CoA mutase cobalamin-binding subunit